MEGKGSFFNIVLLFILAFLALTLAALAGFIFIAGGNKGDSGSQKTVYVTQAPVYKPSADELTSLELVAEKANFNLKNINPNADPATYSPPVLFATVEIKYLIKAPKKSPIKDTAAAVEGAKAEMKEMIGTYFMNMTKEEALTIEGKEKAKKDLLKQFNDLLNENAEAKDDKKQDIIYVLTFPEWSVY